MQHRATHFKTRSKGFSISKTVVYLGDGRFWLIILTREDLDFSVPRKGSHRDIESLLHSSPVQISPLLLDKRRRLTADTLE